ncbi:MAG: phosphatase PAP2 family protein [Solobacterium sp.]|nr:phosphatase PAP2 family protein [Solobacterium sp.]
MDIAILLWLQEFRDGIGAYLAEFLAKMTFLGELNTALVIMAVLYWAVSKDLGTFLLMGWSGNRLVNGVLKVTFCVYRPWIRDARIIPYGNAITTATGYSFPSGHTMNAVSVYGGGAVHKDMPEGLRIVLCLLVLMVAFSRMYLGVHTPQDVLVGTAAGILVMWLIFRMLQWVQENADRDKLVVLAGVVLAAAVAVYAAVKPYPTDYDAAGKLIVDGAKMANDTFKGVGFSMGFLTGWFLERRYVKFTTDVSLTRKLSRVVTGLLLYYAVSLIAVPVIKEVFAGPAGTLLSSYLQVFWISFLFPWCCRRFEKEEQA